MRDFIAMNDIFTTSRDIYSNFKTSLSETENIQDIKYWNDKLGYLNKVSKIYYNLLYQKNIENHEIKDVLYFTKNILGTGAHFPILMKLFMLYKDGQIDENQPGIISSKRVANLLWDGKSK
ncbi:hypothetical protein [Picrophilus oshimae]|uniref:hypothetical protein n=1 Tax=Picrophilus oshimae TaxID=46632 RepID=UPI00064F8764|nr:hypothetical protein [Picrophilus oshimae]